jgi:tetratricopeptide (TPR) repeat protein
MPVFDPRPQYAAAIAALNAGDWKQAQTLAMTLVRDAPPHAGVMFVAGVAALNLGQLPLAVQCLGNAASMNPKRADYLAQQARALAMSRDARAALAAADAAAELVDDQDVMTLDTLGVVYSHVQQHARAAEFMSRVVALAPDDARLHFNLAMSRIYAGDIDGAEASLEDCLRLDPGYWKAHLSLAQLRRQERDHNHVERLRAQLNVAPDDIARMYLELALAKELEDLGDAAQAFAHLHTGKRAGGRSRCYEFSRDQALFESILRAFPNPAQIVGGCNSDEPIFVFGMPRSGTTLVDRILSSHPEVQSAGELENFSIALKRASGSTTAALLDADTIKRTTGLDMARLGQAYLDSTRPSTGRTPRFVDKLPHNFMYIGWIAHALPNAKLICLRRDAMDTCLSNFRQLFAQSSPYYDYSFDLLDTGRYYLAFDRLMAHWQRMLPGRILELRYEELVDAQEPQTRALLEFCGLHWDPACLRFEDNAAPVSTASAVQVRSPMFRSSLQRWRRFESQTLELRQLLEAGGVRIE